MLKLSIPELEYKKSSENIHRTVFSFSNATIDVLFADAKLYKNSQTDTSLLMLNYYESVDKRIAAFKRSIRNNTTLTVSLVCYDASGEEIRSIGIESTPADMDESFVIADPSVAPNQGYLVTVSIPLILNVENTQRVLDFHKEQENAN